MRWSETWGGKRGKERGMEWEGEREREGENGRGREDRGKETEKEEREGLDYSHRLSIVCQSRDLWKYLCHMDSAV